MEQGQKKNMAPLVSVIIPVYNTEKYVEKCIDSVLNNTYKNIEIIIVNNGSSGNIKEIYEQYVNDYPDRLFQIVNHKKNQGLFKARISGVEASKGDFYAFIDSDDKVSVDYYRLLVKEALATGCEMVAAKTIFENPDGALFYSNLSLLDMYSGGVVNKDLLKLLYDCEGKCFSFQLVWNKLYAKSLWKKAYPHFKKIDKHIVMCEDYVFSTIYFALANGMSVVSEAHHHYYKGDDAYTSSKASYEKFEKNVQDLGVVFSATKNFLQELGRYDELKPRHDAFMLRYHKIWTNNIANAELALHEKNKLLSLLDKSLPVKGLKADDDGYDDNFCYSLTTPASELLDYVKKQICDEKVKYISFDIFDTLINRPFLYPSDLFELMSEIIMRQFGFLLDFTKLRMISEESARARLAVTKRSYQDVTLDEIYDEFEKLSGFESNLCDKIKQLEIDLELKYCNRRNAGYDLYSLAIEKGKKVVFTSDMYLPLDVIKEILHKNGYEKYDAIFLSSEIRLTKASGSLYSYVLKHLKISQKELIHIGDNGHSDVSVPKSLGIEAIHFIAARDILQLKSGIYGGDFYNKSFCTETEHRTTTSLSFLGIRAMLGVVANKLYDDPFVNYQPCSDFNGNPNIIGYTALGMHMVGLARWLHKKAENHNTIHFIARDGYLLKQVYEVLYPQEKNNVNYLYVSRKSLIPLMITEPSGFMEISTVVSFRSVSGSKILQYISPIINKEDTEAVKAECQKAGIIVDKKFSTEVEMYEFLSILVKKAYNKKLVSDYRSLMKKYWSNIIKENDITFDIGYSGRTERILSKLLGYKIDCCYVHLNNDNAHKSTLAAGFELSYYYQDTPLVTGALRELIVSEYSASCIGYKIENNKVVPQFEEFTPKYPNAILIERLQNAAVQFAKDLASLYGDDLWLLSFRDNDPSLVLEYYFNKGQIFDRWLFKIFEFEDDLNVGTLGMNLLDFWNMQIQTTNQNNNYNNPGEVFQPARLSFKDKVKDKLKNHPMLFAFAKKIYHVVKRR